MIKPYIKIEPFNIFSIGGVVLAMTVYPILILPLIVVAIWCYRELIMYNQPFLKVLFIGFGLYTISSIMAAVLSTILQSFAEWLEDVIDRYL